MSQNTIRIVTGNSIFVRKLFTIHYKVAPMVLVKDRSARYMVSVAVRVGNHSERIATSAVGLKIDFRFGVQVRNGMHLSVYPASVLIGVKFNQYPFLLNFKY